MTRPHPRPILLYTLIGLTQCFWTANFLVGKVALREFPPLLAAGLRVLIAAACILPFWWWKRRGRPSLARRDLVALAWLGLIAGGINQGLFLLGLSKTSVAHSAFIIGMTPVSVLLLAAARGLERVTPRKLAGMLVAFGGLALLGLERGNGVGPSLAGDLIMLAATACFALYVVLGKEVTHRLDSVTVNAFIFGFGAVLLAPVVAWQGAGFDFGRISTPGWLSILYMALFPSLISYLIFYHALGYVSASRLSMLAYVQPVAATALGVLVLGERVTLPLVAGGAVIVAGVWLAERT